MKSRYLCISEPGVGYGNAAKGPCQTFLHLIDSTRHYLVLTPEDNYINTETVFSNAFNMLFYYDENLTDAENLILPATELAKSCYEYMFAYCTGLTTAPELSATTLAKNCYGFMFSGCTNLNSITCLATDISADKCTENWVSGVAASGTFTRHDSSVNWTAGSSGYPTGWELKNYLE